MEKIKQFFHEVKVEFKKVSFPSWDDLVGSTGVVVVTVIIVSLYLGTVDMGLSKLVQALLK